MADARTLWSDGLLEAGLGSPRAARVLSWPARVERMLTVEAALARVQARRGLLTNAQAETITAACDTGNLDLDALAETAAGAASPVIALLAHLRPLLPEDAKSVLHLGVTSQDIVDTAMVLQVRAALDLLEDALHEMAGRCVELAETHRRTVMPGRTLKQQAVPMTVGLLAARWLGAIDRRLTHLQELRPRLLAVQFGGAAGTLGNFPGEGPGLMADLADELGLEDPGLPWHTERDRIIELAGALSAVTSLASKTAGDILDLASTEVGELRAAPLRGPGSSAMPHKGRNPIDAIAARAAARLANGELQVLYAAAGEHEHERAAGAWQAEWVAVPGALMRTLGAVERLAAALATLEVVEDRGRYNLDANLGLTASEQLAATLASALGRAQAQSLVGELASRAAAEGRLLRDVAAADERVNQALSPDEIRQACDPSTTLGNVDALIDGTLRAYQGREHVGGEERR